MRTRADRAAGASCGFRAHHRTALRPYPIAAVGRDRAGHRETLVQALLSPRCAALVELEATSKSRACLVNGRASIGCRELTDIGVDFSVAPAASAFYADCMSLFALPPVAEMERASLARDTSYDGVFYVAVRTTGIFCRPSCPARKPLPENTEYHATVREALFAGFRPCKRCRPLEADGRLADWMQALLAEIDADPGGRIRDGDLRRRGLEPATVRRQFQARFGMTFHSYCRARRLGGALSRIREGADLDDVSFSSGYESASGFREAFAKLFGDPPGRSRGADCVRLAWLASPLGPLVAGATDAGVCLLEFTDRRMLEAQFVTLRRRLGSAIVPGESEHLERLDAQLAEYFAGSRQRFDVPLVLPGSDFQRQVWNELQRIPYGETRAYGELAAALGSPDASRAVGRANGLNRVAIVVPCHRVVTSAGTLGGYGGGVWRKRWLLELERGNAPAA